MALLVKCLTVDCFGENKCSDDESSGPTSILDNLEYMVGATKTIKILNIGVNFSIQNDSNEEILAFFNLVLELQY